MRTSEEIFRDVRALIATEVLSNADFRETFSGKSGRATAKARIDLLPLLKEAAGLRDIVLLLNIELTFLKTELKHLIHTKESLASFNLAIRQIRAALTMLRHVRAPDEYRWAEAYFTLPDNLTARGLPKDEAHQCFISHESRLRNLLKEPPGKERAALLKGRIANIKLAKDIYTDLQRRALAASAVREPAKPYRVERKPRQAASAVREPAKPYRAERKPRQAASAVREPAKPYRVERKPRQAA